MCTLALVAAVACNKSTSDGSKNRPARRDAGARWQECTDDARSRMEAELLARFDMTISDNRRHGLTCVTIQYARRPAFFVELVGERDGRRRRLHGVLAMDQTLPLVSLRDAKLDWAQLRGARVWFETVDLDGDGTDELLVHRSDDRYPIAEWIDLVVIREPRLVELKGPGISYDDPDIGDACQGTLTIENPSTAAVRSTPSGVRSEIESVGTAQHLVVTTTRSNGLSEHCLASGRHVFTLVGERLVELGP